MTKPGQSATPSSKMNLCDGCLTAFGPKLTECPSCELPLRLVRVRRGLVVKEDVQP